MKIAFCVAEDINLGAGYVMAYLRKEGHDVKLFFDPLQFNRGYARQGFLAHTLGISNNIVKQIAKFQPDILCVSCITATYRWGLYVAERIKHKNPRVKIFFGGVHPTLIPEEVKKHKFIDEVVVGDGIAHFGGKFDPDKLWPDRESFLKVLPPEHRRVQLFMTSFGCPYNCSFCGNEQLRKVKQYKYIQRSADGCIKELIHLKNRGMKYVLFVDDIFTTDTIFLGDFAILYAKNVGLPFACFGHAKNLNEKIIGLLKQAGCHTIWLGVQTADERLRKQILHRPETNAELIAACELIKKAGIKLIIDHIFNLPTENAMSMDISANLYDKLQPDIVNCYELLYFPKAKIIDYALRDGKLFPPDVEKINRGEGITYQVGNKPSKYYREYAKYYISLPLGGHPWDLLPTWVIKLVVHLRAGRAFMVRAILQNEIWFTLRAIKLKLFSLIP